MSGCAKHVGLIGELQKYEPCQGKALFEVVAPGGIKWPACVRHANEARKLGCKIEWLDDGTLEGGAA